MSEHLSSAELDRAVSERLQYLPDSARFAAHPLWTPVQQYLHGHKATPSTLVRDNLVTIEPTSPESVVGGTPHVSGRTSPLVPLAPPGADAQSLAAMLRNELARAVAAAAAEPGAARLPSNFCGLSKLSTAVSTAASHRSTPTTALPQSSSCVSLASLGDASREAACESRVTDASMGATPTLQAMGGGTSLPRVPSCNLLGPSAVEVDACALTAARRSPTPGRGGHFCAPAADAAAPWTASSTPSVSPIPVLTSVSPSVRPSPAPDCQQLHLLAPATATPVAPHPPVPHASASSSSSSACITVLSEGTCGGAALPRIANLRTGCSDGLLLLSSTACIVARDTQQGLPPPKRLKA